MTSLAWKVNRLKLMGPREIFWRVQQLLQKKASKAGWGLVRHVPAPALERLGAVWLHVDAAAAVDRAPVQAAAEAILSGHWQVFALREVALGFPPQWNRDPKTGVLAPMKLGKLIDYRSEHVVGDIKYLWEPSRHLELVTLAQAWRVSGELRYAEAARTFLQSWFDQCPYPYGVHWTSSLELAVRLLNWSCAWQLLGGLASPLFADEAGQRFLRQWLDSVYQHCHFIAGYFSRHSSANNHLFGEYMGLFIASQTWPCWPRSMHWQAMARRGLEQEALRQNWADGVNKEQAIYYHHEVMDMMLLCQLAGQAAGAGFSPAYLQRLERMAEFLVALRDAGGHMPMTGDADDAHMTRLEPGLHDPYASLLTSCAVLFQRPDFKRKVGAFDDKNQWLLGAAGRQLWDALDDSGAEQPVLAFPQGGYFLLGHQFGTSQEVRLVADCAPLGYLSIAAHGHADALAFTLSLGGEEFLIDPGTYAYHTQQSWRNYFRSTAAHNTVEVDGLDQSVIGGNFMWLSKAKARLIGHEAALQLQYFEGEHDGYCRLADPVRHRRRIDFDAERGLIVVKDILQCRERHAVALHWHFAEGCQVSNSVEGLLAQGRHHALALRCNWGEGAALLCASDNPIGGWVSRRFDEKTPTTTARCAGEIQGETVIVTELQIRPMASGH